MKKNKVARRLSLVLLCAGVAAVLIACGGGNPSDDSDPVAQTEREAAQGLFDRLPVSWAPTKLVFNLNPGSRQSIPVTLTTTKALTNARIIFVPDLRNAVTVSPETIPSLAAGQSTTVTLTFAPATTDTRKLIAGVVLLFDRNATVSRPLPVKVSLVTTETINGVTVPPEPPADLNNAALAGFDVNANGVRDDVERVVAREFGGSAAGHSEAFSFARAEQQTILSPSREATAAYAREVDCSTLPMNVVTLALTNTPERRTAFRNANAGMTLTVGRACN